MNSTFKTRLPLFPIILLSLFIIALGVGCGGGGSAAPTFSLGGNISGLINSGLVLQNNGGNNLNVDANANGSFSFTTELSANTVYSVSILSQPLDQTCIVGNGDGTMGAVDNSTVNINCTAENQDAQGLFTTNGDGNATFKDANLLNPDIVKPLTDIKGMVYGDLPEQEFIFFDIASNVLYQGEITAITLTNFIGTATVYNDGVMVDNNVAVSGTIVSRSSIEMTLAASGNFVGGSIKGLYSAAYDNVATKTRISSNVVVPWKSPDAGSVKMEIAGMLTSDVEIDVPDTTISGTYIYSSNTALTDIVCEHSGSLTSGAPKNIYPLNGEQITNLSINCALENSPVYSGFASVVTVDAAGLGTEMWYAVTNGTNSTFMLLTKQN